MNDVQQGGQTVRAMVQDAAASYGSAPFVRFGSETMTYSESHQAATLLAARLAPYGIGPGSLVGVMLQNSLDYVRTYLALTYRGAAVVLVNTAFHGYMLEYVVNDAQCPVLVVDLEFLPAILKSEDALPQLQWLLVRGDRVEIESWSSRFARVKIAAFIDPKEAITEGVQVQTGSARDVSGVSAEDMHCVVYSSGTTGPSKGIMISNAHALSKAREVLDICRFTDQDILYSPLPLFYSMGLLRGVLSVAMLGASIVLRDRFSVSEYWSDVRTHGATVGHCVFSFPHMLKGVTPSPSDADNSLRCMFNARYDAEFEERFGLRMIESYGLTEAGNAIYNRYDEPVVPGSCGRASDEWAVRLGTPAGDEVAIGETGEILLRPRLPGRIMLGYLNKADATARAFRDLWFHTGDLASKDERGYFTYQGRTKEMIRRRGQNISAWEVEQILLTHPDVLEAAALAQPAEVGDDDLRVVIVSRPAAARPLDLDALVEFCVDRMPAYMVPRLIEEREELPKTPSGRVEKYKLEESQLAPHHVDRGPQVRRA